MKWKKINTGTFTYNGKKVNREKVVYNTFFGDFNVFQSVNGKYWYSQPFINNPDLNASNGHKDGIKEWLGLNRVQCASMEEGMKICEAILIKLKNEVNKC